MPSTPGMKTSGSSSASRAVGVSGARQSILHVAESPWPARSRPRGIANTGMSNDFGISGEAVLLRSAPPAPARSSRGTPRPTAPRRAPEAPTRARPGRRVHRLTRPSFPHAQPPLRTMNCPTTPITTRHAHDQPCRMWPPRSGAARCAARRRISVPSTAPHHDPRPPRGWLRPPPPRR